MKNVTPDRAFTQRQIDRDRLTPIRWPLEPHISDSLLGVSLEEAWLPLSIALVNRIQRLWDLVVGPSLHSGRVSGDEYLYQILRRSLLGVTESTLADTKTLTRIQSDVPPSLPTLSQISNFEYEDSERIREKFQSLELLLVGDAVTLDLYPDTRTVADVLAPFDRYFDRLELEQYRSALAASYLGWEDREKIEAIVTERERLLRFGEIGDLAVTVAILARVEEIWTLLYDKEEHLRRYKGDEDIYQTYRNLLLDCLDSPEYIQVHQLAQQRVPELLPSDDELNSDPSIVVSARSRFRRLHYETIALANRLQKSTIFDGFDDVRLKDRFPREERAWAAFQMTVNRARVATPDDGHSEGQAGKRGRKSKDVPIDVARRVYWDLWDELGTGRPTQKEVCERLAEHGIHISLRAFSGICKKWREMNIEFPGIRPEIEAENA